jgi:hypothetical protein
VILAMAVYSEQTGFVVWGIDQTPYGPVELPVLVAWVKDERVTADTWVFVETTGVWQKAGKLDELQMFFGGKPAPTEGDFGALTAPRGTDARILRRIKILAGFTDAQLQRFGEFLEVEKVPAFAVVVKQGEPGDAMYFILEGELRVRMDLLQKETTLATLGVGEFFGDIALFDRGPRSADVVANRDSLLARFTTAAFDGLAEAAPDLATPFLRAIGRTLTARIRADNKRYGDSVSLSRAAE